MEHIADVEEQGTCCSCAALYFLRLNSSCNVSMYTLAHLTHSGALTELADVIRLHANSFDMRTQLCDRAPIIRVKFTYMFGVNM